MYPQHKEWEGLPQSNGIWCCLSPPKLHWPYRVSTAGQPRARSLFAVCAAHVTRVPQLLVLCPAGIRVLDGPLTDSMEAIAFNKHYQINDIYSCR